MTVDAEVLDALQRISMGMQVTAQGVMRLAERLDQLEQEGATGLIVPEAGSMTQPATLQVVAARPGEHIADVRARLRSVPDATT